MRRTDNFTISDFYCTQCGCKGINVARRPGQQRSAGHLKKIYCLKCKKEQNFVEIKGFGAYTKIDFLFEYTYHNFDESGKRIEPNYKKFINETLIKIEKGDLPKNDIYYQIIERSVT